MSTPYARIRVRREQAELLYALLFRERGNLIAAKIAARSAGEDPADLRRDLITIKWLMEEAKRAMRDIDEEE